MKKYKVTVVMEEPGDENTWTEIHEIKASDIDEAEELAWEIPDVSDVILIEEMK